MGRASDVWSLGCILYQLVYGKPPFAHLPMMKRIQCIPDPRFIIPFPPLEDADVLSVLQSCLQRDPKKRPTIPELLEHPYLKSSAKFGLSLDVLLHVIDEIVQCDFRVGEDVARKRQAALLLQQQLSTHSDIDLSSLFKQSCISNK